MANPIEDSQAAITKINIAKICPVISPKQAEKIIKFKLTERRASSSDIRTTTIFVLFKITPPTPIINNKVDIKKK